MKKCRSVFERKRRKHKNEINKHAKNRIKLTNALYILECADLRETQNQPNMVLLI